MLIMGRKDRDSIYYFLEKCVISPYTCWKWNGKIHIKTGYAGFSHKQKDVLGHRFSYEYFIGDIPKGYVLHHKCENKWCVNPEHLKPVTKKEHKQEHRKEYCIRGHQFTEINTYMTPDGRRQCRQCYSYRLEKSKYKTI